jgi:hypothetical protein
MRNTKIPTRDEFTVQLNATREAVFNAVGPLESSIDVIMAAGGVGTACSSLMFSAYDRTVLLDQFDMACAALRKDLERTLHGSLN